MKFPMASAWPLLVVVYLITGKLGLLLAQPPGYATAIFPPAGIALAVVLVAGRTALPWIFSGALLLNLWVGYDATKDVPVGLASALLIAAASTVQAAVGGSMLRGSVGYPTRLDNSRDLIAYALRAPLICLISSSISVLGLIALGVLPLATSGANWLSWWLGDTTGVLVMLPITLVAIGEPRSLWRRRAVSVALPMAVALVLVVISFILTSRWEQEESLTEFRGMSRQAYHELRLRFEQQESLLEQVEGLLSHQEDGKLSRAEFARFIRGSLKRFPMIQAVEWAPLVKDNERVQFEATQRKQIPDFAIRERDGDGHLLVAARREFYYPITLVEPMANNEAALGFDLASSAQRRAAMAQAAGLGAAVATAPLRLVQESRDQAGILLIQSVRDGPRSGDVILTALRMGDFMARLLSFADKQLQARLQDVDSGHVLYDSFLVAGDPGLTEESIILGTRHYRLLTAPTPAYLAAHRGWQSWVALVLGLLGTGLLGVLLLLGSGQKDHAEELVKERTRDLREKSHLLDSIIENIPAMVFLKRASDLRFELFNRAGETLLCRDRSELLGRNDYDFFPKEQADFFTGKDRETLAQTGMLDIPEETIETPDGPRILHTKKLSLRDEQGQPRYLLGISEDITERRAAEELIRNLAFYDVLTGLPNRRLLDDRLNQAMAASKRSGCYGALMFLDLDNFKPLNDKHGHEVGDLLLIEVAARLMSCMRETDTVGRFGGDEFVVLLSELNSSKDTSTQQARTVAEKIGTRLSEPYRLIAKHEGLADTTIEHRCTASIGVALFLDHEASQDDVLKCADSAMYQAKQAGRNSIRFFGSET